MAFQFIAAAHYDNSSSNSAVIAKPTGTANDDIMFAFFKYNTDEDLTPPSGWVQLGTRRVDSGGIFSTCLYWKLAASEGADYTFSRANTSRFGGTIVTYRDGFDTADPIDVVSDTAYSTNDTTVRAAAMTVSAADSPLIYFGVINAPSTDSFSPPTVPTTFTENVDAWNTDSRSTRTVASVVWSGSGSTSDMDATVGTALANKHAYAVALNPASATASAPKRSLLLGIG